MLLDQVDALNAQIGKLTSRIEQLIAAIPAAQGRRHYRPSTGTGPGAPVLPAVDRLDEITGIGPDGARAIICGDRAGHEPVPHRRAPGVMGQAEPAHHPVRAPQPRRQDRQGQPLPQSVLGEAAAAAARTDTFLGERYRRIVKRCGKLKALVASRSILVIIWHLLSDPAARYQDLGAGYHASRIDKVKKVRNHIRQQEAVGYTVALTQAA